MSSIAGKARRDTVANLWDRPDLVRSFTEAQLLYDQLAQEVAFSLEKRVRDKKIPFDRVTKRTKSLESFAEKIERRHYHDPFNQITDRAGVRIVFLYQSTRAEIESLIEAEFKVLEKI